MAESANGTSSIKKERRRECKICRIVPHALKASGKTVAKCWI
ncbi:hypothetical protein C7S13_3994 [Burkholderia cepacia]|nr:hypothetical protein [Burkholderia cepacia]